MRLVKQLLAYFPTKLPLGMTEFETFSKSVIELLPPGLDNVPADDKKFVIASAIQRLDPTTNAKAKIYFVKLLTKAAASQVAGQVFLDIKEKQKAVEAERAAKQAEVTAQTAAPECPTVNTNA